MIMGRKLKYNEIELLQSQAQAERVLMGIECFRIKNQELRIKNQEQRAKIEET